MSSPGSNTGNEYIHELLSHLEDAARNGFNTKPGNPEPHRDLMIAESDKINQLFRNATSPKNEKQRYKAKTKR
jgi:hypothetical protein